MNVPQLKLWNKCSLEAVLMCSLQTATGDMVGLRVKGFLPLSFHPNFSFAPMNEWARNSVEAFVVFALLFSACDCFSSECFEFATFQMKNCITHGVVWYWSGLYLVQVWTKIAFNTLKAYQQTEKYSSLPSTTCQSIFVWEVSSASFSWVDFTQL